MEKSQSEISILWEYLPSLLHTVREKIIRWGLLVDDDSSSFSHCQCPLPAVGPSHEALGEPSPSTCPSHVASAWKAPAHSLEPSICLTVKLPIHMLKLHRPSHSPYILVCVFFFFRCIINYGIWLTFDSASEFTNIWHLIALCILPKVSFPRMFVISLTYHPKFQCYMKHLSPPPRCRGPAGSIMGCRRFRTQCDHLSYLAPETKLIINSSSCIHEFM